MLTTNAVSGATKMESESIAAEAVGVWTVKRSRLYCNPNYNPNYGQCLKRPSSDGSDLGLTLDPNVDYMPAVTIRQQLVRNGK